MIPLAKKPSLEPMIMRQNGNFCCNAFLNQLFPEALITTISTFCCRNFSNSGIACSNQMGLIFSDTTFLKNWIFCFLLFKQVMLQRSIDFAMDLSHLKRTAKSKIGENSNKKISLQGCCRSPVFISKTNESLAMSVLSKSKKA